MKRLKYDIPTKNDELLIYGVGGTIDYVIGEAIVFGCGKSSGAKFKLNIIKRALNLGYDLELTENCKDSYIYYPYNPFTDESSNYVNEFNADKSDENKQIKIIGKIKNKGVLYNVLGGEDENIACRLSKRVFSNTDKRTAYERQKGICPITSESLPIEEMQADHIIPWWKGGTTTLSNLQMISKLANARKGGK